MTDRIIKRMLNEFDLDLLSVYERAEYEYQTTYNRLPKFTALLKIIYSFDDLCDNLQEIKELITEYELTVFCDE